jgi:hypothetical protein
VVSNEQILEREASIQVSSEFPSAASPLENYFSIQIYSEYEPFVSMSKDLSSLPFANNLNLT